MAHETVDAEDPRGSEAEVDPGADPPGGHAEPFGEHGGRGWSPEPIRGRRARTGPQWTGSRKRSSKRGSTGVRSYASGPRPLPDWS